MRQGTRPWQIARLEDISATGFRIGWLPNTTKHAPLRIRIPGLEMLSAHVRWQQDDAIGCEFTAPLHIAVFEHIVWQAELGGQRGARPGPRFRCGLPARRR